MGKYQTILKISYTLINFIIAIFATKDTTCTALSRSQLHVVTMWLILGIMKLIHTNFF